MDRDCEVCATPLTDDDLLDLCSDHATGYEDAR